MTWKEIAEYYSVDLSDIDIDEQQDYVYDYLCDNTTCLNLGNGSFVFVVF